MSQDQEFERMLRERSPRSIDGVEWAIYNQWVSEQRTARRLEQEAREPLPKRP